MSVWEAACVVRQGGLGNKKRRQVGSQNRTGQGGECLKISFFFFFRLPLIPTCIYIVLRASCCPTSTRNDLPRHITLDCAFSGVDVPEAPRPLLARETMNTACRKRSVVMSVGP